MKRDVCLSVCQFVSMGLELNQVHYYRGRFVACWHQAWLIDGDDGGAISGMSNRQGKPKYSEKTSRTLALSTTDPT
jgi:hypothetical protein